MSDSLYEPIQRRFNFGDLVKTEDEPQKIFRIIAYSVEIYFSPDETTKDLMYELLDIDSDVYSGGAFDDELTLIATADQADQFLANRQRKAQMVDKLTMKIEVKKAEETPTVQWDDKTMRKLVDYILDRYNDYQALATDLKGIAPKAALREWRKLSKECLKDLRELTGGE